MAIQIPAPALCLAALLLLPAPGWGLSLGRFSWGRQTQAQDELDCDDAAHDESGRCYKAITWAFARGLQAHPDWYPDVSLTRDAARLSSEASFKEVQASLYRRGKAGCGKPCPMGYVRPPAPSA
ncbi:unnamed protein product, partial [Prorocentrum cordatum]